MWNTHVNLTDADRDAVAEVGKVTLSAERRLDLKAEIESQGAKCLLDFRAWFYLFQAAFLFLSKKQCGRNHLQ